MTQAAQYPEQDWHIQLCETLAHWSYLHHLGFGRAVYHTFLRVVDPQDKVVQEIHGGAALMNGSQAERISTKNFLCAATRSLLLNGRLPDFALLARVHDGYYRSVLHTHNIVSGDEKTVKQSWLSALDMTSRFNTEAPLYDTRKINCNSLTRTLAEAIAHTLPQRKTYAPGFENRVEITRPPSERWSQELADGRYSLTTLKREAHRLSQQINKPFLPVP